LGGFGGGKKKHWGGKKLKRGLASRLLKTVVTLKLWLTRTKRDYQGAQNTKDPVRGGKIRQDVNIRATREGGTPRVRLKSKERRVMGPQL